VAATEQRGSFGRPRVGHIQFLNCLPIYWGLVQSGALLDMDLHKDTPDRLNDALVAGDLDIGPISLVDYLRHADELLLLPDLAVGSDGPVLSVNLVSQVPLDELDEQPVALGSTSRTSVVLAQYYLEEKLGVRPRYFTCPPDLTAMMLEAKAAVLIGDTALRATYDAPLRGLVVHDLGSIWREISGLPMVFAVWAARRDFTTAHPGLVKDVHNAFVQSRDYSLAHIDEVAASAARWEDFDEETLRTYFRALDFQLGERQVAGLTTFASAVASRVGLTSPVLPEFVPF
jgi:chorismate dehydratase